MKEEKKKYRIEFYDKGIYEFDNFNEARNWAKEQCGEKSFNIFHYKDFDVRRVKKDFSFTKTIEYDEYLKLKGIR